jgi:hypothetical protein
MRKDGRFDGTRPSPGLPKVFTEEYINEIADIAEEWYEDVVYNKGPFFWSDFAQLTGHSKYNFSKWAKENEKFRLIYRKIKEYQRERITEEAIKNNYSSSFCQFYLKAHFKEIYGDVSLSEKQIVYNNTYYSEKPPKTWEEEQQNKEKA